jgi:putative transposase
MRDLLILAIHLLVTLAKLLRPDGARAVAAESLVLKQQLLIINRTRQRAPILTALDRFVLGLTGFFIRPHRIPKLAAILKPATLFKFHKALIERRYRLLFLSSFQGRRPGPKAPSGELIAAIVEIKCRNPCLAACASQSRSPTPSVSTSTRMSCGVCFRNTDDPTVLATPG